MKRFLALCALCLLGSVPSGMAQDFPVQVTLFPPASSSGPEADQQRFLFSLNVLFGRIGSLQGLQIGGLGNHTREQAYGVSIGGLGNSSADARGLMVGGLGNNVRGDLKGVSIGGLGSSVKGNAQGLMVGGLGSAVKGDARGLIVGGLGSSVKGNAQGLMVGGLGATANGHMKGLLVSGLGTTVHGELKGGQIAGMGSTVKGNAKGVIIGGLGSTVRGDLKGMLVGGLGSTVRGTAQGMLVGGLGSTVRGDTDGLQIGGIASSTRGEMEGVQISGLYNRATDLHGVQIGLVNVVDSISHGFQLGVVSIERRNIHQEATLFTSSLLSMGASYKVGRPVFYNHYTMGINWHERNCWALGMGFGSFQPINSFLYVQPELGYLWYIPTNFKDLKYGATLNLSVALGIRINPFMWVYVAPGVYGGTFRLDTDGKAWAQPSQIDPFYTRRGDRHQHSVGMSGSIGIRFAWPIRD